MKHYKYYLTWNGNIDLTADDNNQFLTEYNTSCIQVKNGICRSDFYLRDIGYLLFISKVNNESLVLCVAVRPDEKSEDDCATRIKESFSDLIISACKEITETEFINELLTADEIYGGELTAEMYYLSVHHTIFSFPA